MVASPETPETSKIRNFPHEETPPNSPLYQVRYKDYQSAIEAIQQLESELTEFQTSSYELEKELEEELTNLELENSKLKEHNTKLNAQVKELNLNKYELEKKRNQKVNELNEQIKKLTNEIDEKNSKLVDIEILNDNIEQNERNLSILYKELEERYLNQSESLIIIETEITDLKDDYLKEQLNHQNTKNELADLREKYEQLLSSPIENTRPRSLQMTKSNSLMQLHSMIESTKDMESKIGNIKHSLNNRNLKFTKRSNPTTKLSNTTITTTSTPSRQRSHSASENRTLKIPLSPSSFKLSSLSNTQHFNTLEKIEGSPNREVETPRPKRNLFGGVLSSKKTTA